MESFKFSYVLMSPMLEKFLQFFVQKNKINIFLRSYSLYGLLILFILIHNYGVSCTKSSKIFYEIISKKMKYLCWIAWNSEISFICLFIASAICLPKRASTCCIINKRERCWARWSRSLERKSSILNVYRRDASLKNEISKVKNKSYSLEMTICSSSVNFRITCFRYTRFNSCLICSMRSGGASGFMQT